MAKRPIPGLPEIPDPVRPGTKIKITLPPPSPKDKEKLLWVPETPPTKMNWKSIAKGPDVGRETGVIVKANVTKSNKKYNVGTSTAADPTVNPILYGGGGGGVMVTPEKPSFLSSIPSIVWIILAVGGGYFLIKSSKGKGKLF